jgi:hypothetical protein
MIEESLVKPVKNQLELSPAPSVVVIDSLGKYGSDDSQSAQRRILLNTLTRGLAYLVCSNSHLSGWLYDQQVYRRITFETGEFVSCEIRNGIWIFFQWSFNNPGQDSACMAQ